MKFLERMCEIWSDTKHSLKRVPFKFYLGPRAEPFLMKTENKMTCTNTLPPVHTPS